MTHGKTYNKSPRRINHKATKSKTNTGKLSPLKTENFQIKISAIFHISAQNTDRGYSLDPPRRGGSNEYPQPMFLSKNKKNNVYPCKPQFYYIKVGFKGVILIYACFRDATLKPRYHSDAAPITCMQRQSYSSEGYP